MTDIKRALLGDHKGVEWVTHRGELIPCPFCGDVPESSWSTAFGMWNILHHCKIAGHISVMGGTRENAEKRWNTRAPILSAEEMEKLDEH